MSELKEIFRVDEIVIGRYGDSSVGEANEFSTIMLSDEMSEILKDDNQIENFKKDLFALFKKYNDDVYEITDDVEDIGNAYYEMLPDIPEEEMQKRIDDLESKVFLKKGEKMELHILKKELEK